MTQKEGFHIPLKEVQEFMVQQRLCLISKNGAPLLIS